MRRNRMDYWTRLISGFVNPMCLFADDEPAGGGATDVIDAPADASADNLADEPDPSGADPSKTDDKGDGKTPQPQFVPYERFKEVNDRMKRAEADRKADLQRLAVLEQRVASSQPKPGEKPRYEDPEDQKVYEKFLQPIENANKAEIKALREEIEVKNTEIQIQKELTELQGKYSKMNRRDVYVALLDPNNAEKSIEELAKASHEDRGTFAKSVIEEYLKSKKGDTPATLPEGESPSVATAKAPKEAKTFADRMKWAQKAAGQFISNLKK